MVTLLLPDLNTCRSVDRRELLRLARVIRSRQRSGKPFDRLLAELEQSALASRLACEARRLACPPLHYPELPVAARRAEILAAIRAHPVIILCGATGSGKTTQLPKICLELGLADSGLIGVTQPRRIAARTIARYLEQDFTAGWSRAAQAGERLPPLDDGLVGFKVRFHDRVGPNALVKVMTDGILLAETQSDPLLSAYNAIILDEAHERSVTIDFLLGYLKNLLPRRPELKVVVSSATLDAAKFSAHFNHAPVLEVSGRAYPVEVRYRPLDAPDEPDSAALELNDALVAAVDELCSQGPGDVLVFLPGEREIRDAALALRKHHPPHTEILPLYARLSSADQDRVFQPHAQRRIVLATNVAETSLTVPGILYVVDSGLARIGRYSGRSGVQRLPVEKISRASADQRQGRCGRVAPGVCIRLYSAEDYLNRPAYTEPEILRASLAAVMLHMRALKLGEPEQFPFIDPPPLKAVREGQRLLQELGALDRLGELTEIGWQLARLPVDPRLGRMLLAARERGALSEVLVIAAALGSQDPRDQPADRREAAAAAHRLHQDAASDFTAILNLWRFIFDLEHSARSKSQFQRALQAHFLSPWRVREWRETHTQLERLVKEMGLHPNEIPADYAQVHQALLAGLLGRLGQKVEKQEYLGSHQTRFLLHPASGVRKPAPDWLMAGELVETSQLYARTCARIDPLWIEPIAGDLCRKSHSEPRWEAKRGQVVVSERVTLYGLTIIAARPVAFAPIDPLEARRLFIQAALVEGEWRSQAPFFVHNQQLVAEIREMEQRSRRRDLLVDDADIFAFYDALLPPGIASSRDFDTWRKQAERRSPQLLFLDRATLLRGGAAALAAQDYPGHLTIAGHELPLAYHFEPGGEGDGVTVTIPLPLLNQLPEEPFQWLTPGLLEKKLLALLKGLPQNLRRSLVPLPTTVEACLAELRPRFAQEPLLTALEKALLRLRGTLMPHAAWRLEALPEHLSMRFAIVAADGRQVLAQGRNLAELRLQLTTQALTSFQQLPKGEWERDEVQDWNCGPLPEQVAFTVQGRPVTGYPALVAEEGGRVALRLLDAADHANQAHRAGLRRLFMRHVQTMVKQLVRSLPLPPAIAAATAVMGGAGPLRQELTEAAVEQVFFPAGANTIRSREAFQQALERGRAQLWPTAEKLAQQTALILTRHQEATAQLKLPGVPAPVREDVTAQLAQLVHPGFLLATPSQWLNHLPRYLQAARLRVERARNAPTKEQAKAGSLTPWLARWAKLPPPGREQQEAWTNLRWLLEEFRVSLFAQELKTAVPVSKERLEQEWQKITRP